MKNIFEWLFKHLADLILFGFWFCINIKIYRMIGTINIVPVDFTNLIISMILCGFALYGVKCFIVKFKKYL